MRPRVRGPVFGSSRTTRSAAAWLLLGVLAAAGVAQDDPVAAARRLRELRQDGRLDEALATAARLPAPLLADERVAGEHAQVLLRVDRASEAVEVVKRFADRPQVAHGLAMARAHVHVAAGDTETATRMAHAGLAQDVARVGWLEVLVRARVAAGDADGAAAALATMPEDAPAFLRRDLDVDVLAARAARAGDDPDRLEESVALLEQALALDPARVDVRMDLVLDLVSWHREDRAEALAREGLAQLERPFQRADMLYALGVVQRARMDVEGSLATFAQALALAPGHERARVGVARSLLKAGRTDEAAAALEALLVLAPDSVEGLLAKGEVELARRDAARALEALERLLARQPDHDRALYLLARAQAMAGRESDAALSMRRYQELVAGP